VLSGGRHRAADRGQPVRSGRPELLPGGLRAAATAMAAIAAAVVLGLAVRYAGDSAPGRVDGHLDRAVDALPGHRLARMVIVFGSPGVVAVAAVVVALICLLARRPRAAALAVAGPGVTGLVTTFGKPLVDRTIGHAGDLAFPSGHTGGATSLALVVALLAAAVAGLGVGGTAALAVVSAVGAGGVVGTGMVIGGSHYPTDVVGGFCTAVAAVLAVALALDAASSRRRTVAPDGVR
jgi:membrane-associated phospholipid phosphatase